MISFPNRFSVTTELTLTRANIVVFPVREYVVIDPDCEVAAAYPFTDIGWVDALVHAARGKPL